MHTTIIAEAGVNHNGSMTLAKQMVEKAKQACLRKIPDVRSRKAGLPFRPESRISEGNDRSGRVAASDVTEAGTDTGGFYRTTGVL